jgi:hypothetical protein
MEHPHISVRRTSIKYGFYTGLAHIGYFLLLIITGLIEVIELHFLTGLFLVVGVVVAISRFKAARRGMIEYLQGLSLGLLVGLVSSALFALAQVIGDYLFNMAFTGVYRSRNFFFSDLSIWVQAILWIVFGIWVGAITGFIAMQYFKSPDHKMKES